MKMANAPLQLMRSAAAMLRIRLRRQQARVRLFLVGDVALLARYHISKVPEVPRGDRAYDADLRSEVDLLRREL